MDHKENDASNSFSIVTRAFVAVELIYLAVA
jgi:hypothetical protein